MHEQKSANEYFILIIGLFFLLYLFIFFYNIIKYHKKNIKLYSEKLKAEMNGREIERSRISKDLHDDLGANLSSINMLLQGIKDLPLEQKKLLDAAKKNLESTIDSMRNIMSDLYPTALEKYGLEICLTALCDKINYANTLNIYFTNEVKNLEMSISNENKIHVFRIVKEIIQNTIKHSHSPILYIDIKEKSNSVLVISKDEGVGFDASTDRYLLNGNGLKNIITRIDIIKGYVLLETSIGSGVIYTIEIPKSNAKVKN